MREDTFLWPDVYVSLIKALIICQVLSRPISNLLGEVRLLLNLAIYIVYCKHSQKTFRTTVVDVGVVCSPHHGVASVADIIIGAVGNVHTEQA